MENILELREKYSISLSELSIESNIPIAIISQIEKMENLNEEDHEVIQKLFRAIYIIRAEREIKSKKERLNKQIENEISKEEKVLGVVFKGTNISIFFSIVTILILNFMPDFLNTELENFKKENSIINIKLMNEELLKLEKELNDIENNSSIESSNKIVENNKKEDLKNSIILVNEELLKLKKKLGNIDKSNNITIDTNLIIILFLLWCMSGFIFFLIKNTRKEKEKFIDKLSVEELIGELEKDFINNIVKVNIYQINSYNSQTKSQANKSFIIAIITAIVGLGIVCFGLYLLYSNKLDPGYYATGVGVFMEFIAGIVFYLYNKTVIKMGEYYKKLVLVQNIGLALKATDDFEEGEKQNIRGIMVQSLLQDINKYLAEK